MPRATATPSSQAIQTFPLRSTAMPVTPEEAMLPSLGYCCMSGLPLTEAIDCQTTISSVAYQTASLSTANALTGDREAMILYSVGFS
ncbi:hypothetical protein R80B4_02628 [Fibrobacteres bacterium R8-0-B4]